VKKKLINRELAEQAVEIYLRLAYGPGSEHKAHSMFEDENSGDEKSVFVVFQEETRLRAEARASSLIQPTTALQRFSIRLGNRNYPFMKLVLQEHLVRGEFYFGVDTHDQMELKPNMPDYDSWLKVKRFNLDLKLEIDQAFVEQGVPTLAEIRQEQESENQNLERVPKGQWILVVDDEVEEARTLEQFLWRQGFDVKRAKNGREALDALETLEPVLLVLDWEMPEMDGLSLIQELRSREETRDLPILLTSASQMMSPEKSPADSFLAKPYDSVDLIRMVDRLLSSRG